MSVDTRVPGAFASLLLFGKPFRAETNAFCSFTNRSLSLHSFYPNFSVPATLFISRDHLYRRRSTSVRATDSRDSGHWNLSPEWWGTQAGGWGRDAGSVVFDRDSLHGNGVVTVTSHAASLPPGAADTEEHEWRVLRFNQTRQSVSRVVLQHGSGAFEARADCLAFGYLKTMASAAAAILSMMGKIKACAAHRDKAKALKYATQSTSEQSIPSEAPRLGEQQASTCRALCIGLGGGTLPNFLSHHLPGLHVDAIELDPVVVAAATECMGLPRSRHNMRLLEGDAADYILQLASEVQQGQAAPLDIAFVDAFDGNDDVPSIFCSPDSPVLDALATALHPEQGSVVMNLHGGGVPTSSALVALFSSWLPLANKRRSQGFHPGTQQGRAVLQTTAAIRDKLLGTSELGSAQDGSAFTLSVAYQSNITVVVSRALKGIDEQDMAEAFASAAQKGGITAGYLFDAGSRAQRGLTFV